MRRASNIAFVSIVALAIAPVAISATVAAVVLSFAKYVISKSFP